MVKENWTTANIRINLMKEIKKTIESDVGKKSGLTNPNQFVDTAIRDLINKLESKRFSHQNTYDDKVRILDNKIGKMGDIVTIFLRDEFKKGFCDYCESESCVHVKYMWELKDVVKILKKRGFHSPYD
ncbi:MAG: hypothetical protein HRU07_05645 [Nitrosopumilus sp.]|nr:hypothetical protein [Nitrosopumilus sp.]NRA05629.1 hypothetical protein [Nitrosopumilus sp.]